MAQQPIADYPIDPVVTSGTQLADVLNRTNQVLNSGNSGPTRPPMLTEGGLWVKTGGATPELFMFDGTNDLPFVSSSDLGAYLPLAGGTVTGNLAVNGTTTINSGTINGTTVGATTPSTVKATNLAYTGTLTGGTGVVAIGGSQIYKDIDGNVGIGTTSPTALYKLHVAGNQFIDGNVRVTGSTIRVVGSPGATIPSFQPGDDENSGLYWARTDVIGLSTAGLARLQCDELGNVLIGAATTAATSYGLKILNDNTVSKILRIDRQSADGPVAQFGRGGTQVGRIDVTSTATAYVTSSDYRLKENIAPMTGALEKVAALKPCTYKWKSTGEMGQGFIAHELQAVVPECVVGAKDAVETLDDVDAEGLKIGTKEVPAYQGIDTSFLVATLVAAIQELSAKVAALEAK
jgi:hypothetical protein